LFLEAMDSGATTIPRNNLKKKRNASDTQTTSPPCGMVVLNIILSFLNG